MKHIALSGCSILLMSALIAPGVKAESNLYAPRTALNAVAIAGTQPILQAQVPADSALRRPRAEAPPANAARIGMGVTPVMVVFLAYQGFFESEGIPKFDTLVSESQSGRVSAKDLVQAAVNMKRLPASSLENQAYLNAVDYQLLELYRDR